MNFPCPQCPAKYYVSDAKLAGRTLTMRCRKCGYLIPIRAEPSKLSLAAAPMIRAESLSPPYVKGFVPGEMKPLGILWHVGIGGVVVGPMSRQELSSRVLEGSVDAQSFVWHQSMSAWTRLPEVPGLADLLLPPSPAGVPPSMPVVARSQRLKTSDVNAPALVDAGEPQEATEGSDFAGSTKEADDFESSLQSKRASPVETAFALLAAVAFGFALGFVFFGGEKIKVVAQIVEIPAKTGSPSGIAPPPPPPSQEEVLPSLSASKPKATAALKRSKTHRKPPRQDKEEVLVEEVNQDSHSSRFKGLSNLDGVGTPARSSSLPEQASQGDGALSESQIRATIAKYQAGVKRGCWERALMTRDRGAPGTARVNIAIQVEASGSVTSASTGGEPPGYHGLASCIQRRVRGWTFPRSGDRTTVNLPFVFAAQ